MPTLTGSQIYLRALEPEDLDFMYAVENDESVWEVSHTQTPYSKFLIRQYLENAHQDIYEAKQLRLAICNIDNRRAIGLVDLFEYDPKNNRAGMGILLHLEKDRQKGVGTEAVKLLIDYTFSNLNLHQLYVNINPANAASVKLFTNFGFLKNGEKKQWNLVNGTYKDEDFYQLINPQHQSNHEK